MADDRRLTSVLQKIHTCKSFPPTTFAPLPQQQNSIYGILMCTFDPDYHRSHAPDYSLLNLDKVSPALISIFNK